MSPRAPATTSDQSARRFLDAAADLIDTYLSGDPSLVGNVARLKQIRFPAAFEWLRTEDVIRLANASGGSGASRTAFFNRWKTRDEFLPDALIHALRREHAAGDPQDYVDQVDQVLVPEAAPSAVIRDVGDGLLAGLLPVPRTYMVMHLGPLLPQHRELWEALIPEFRRSMEVWYDSYATFLDMHSLSLRPGWTIKSIGFAYQSLLDGFVLRSRVLPDDFAELTSNDDSSGFADTLMALLVGAIDWDGAGRTTAAELDHRIADRAAPEPAREEHGAES
jgi:AcrR family transcriptional regulator